MPCKIAGNTTHRIAHWRAEDERAISKLVKEVQFILLFHQNWYPCNLAFDTFYTTGKNEGPHWKMGALFAMSFRGCTNAILFFESLCGGDGEIMALEEGLYLVGRGARRDWSWRGEMGGC